MNTIQEAWERYRQEVVPADAPTIQLVETKRAFFGGAAAILSVTAYIGESDMSEDAGTAILEGLFDEVMQYAVSPA